MPRLSCSLQVRNCNKMESVASHVFRRFLWAPKKLLFNCLQVVSLRSLDVVINMIGQNYPWSYFAFIQTDCTFFSFTSSCIMQTCLCQRSYLMLQCGDIWSLSSTIAKGQPIQMSMVGAVLKLTIELNQFCLFLDDGKSNQVDIMHSSADNLFSIFQPLSIVLSTFDHFRRYRKHLYLSVM